MANLATFVEQFSAAEVLVVGDLILDDYVWGNVDRISPEAPVPVVSVTSRSQALGGAGNVFHNIIALGGKARVCGIIGDDQPGQHLRHALEACCVPDQRKGTLGLCTDRARPTTQKTRVIANNQQVVRVDTEQAGDLNTEVETLLLEQIADGISRASCLAISDYAKGVVTASIMRAVVTMAAERRIPVIVDPKVEHFSRYHGVTMLTPNQREAMLAAGVWPPLTTNPELIEQAGRTIQTQQQCDALLITQGEHGMSLFERDQKTRHIQTTARPVFDVTGAGDTVLATLALALSTGASFYDAAVLSTSAAGIVVGKVGTSTVSPRELLKSLATCDSETAK
ncbi:MAG TPA: D-glycero-beta-D-manno-heptose-7-phosphate kinase [Nitrospirales bacterium]|nr:D-glycero-beta-D-manno-heptose-7-phosphate kinase [Nitrospirales bacterium]HIB54885.1 D-glycero-beta-D-manno-heptose-7-phosphate kinase [Nitrospirales bacterium]HIN32451.1 D-glycero-beta-D-manno-heptose-7-phosphate kinase [Nitrospirales bacterium]HIO22344.1 D-glycero-beta-D-manno-heptose-7-phosphate kinase [Nitrospirales bacterium]